VRAADVELLGGPRFVGTRADPVARGFARPVRPIVRAARAFERAISSGTRRRVRVGAAASYGRYAVTHVGWQGGGPIDVDSTTILVRRGGRQIVAASDAGTLACDAAPRAALRAFFGWCEVNGSTVELR
jgi:hypothetical protein